jgi:putative SOS response-associated peptidase YedK
MCGRYVTADIAEAERNLVVDLVLWREYQRSYNVAPTDRVPVVRLVDGQREALTMRWGLIPYFASGLPPKYSTINAAIEKLETNACWRGPWQRGQRCVLPAAGFYEWHGLADGRKQPYYVTCADQPLFWFAGLWDSSNRSDGRIIQSCSIITMPANALMHDLHNAGANPHRMPAILAREQVETWLNGPRTAAQAALAPYPADIMVAHPVSTRVNTPKNNDAQLLNAAQIG